MPRRRLPESNMEPGEVVYYTEYVPRPTPEQEAQLNTIQRVREHYNVYVLISFIAALGLNDGYMLHTWNGLAQLEVLKVLEAQIWEQVPRVPVLREVRRRRRRRRRGTRADGSGDSGEVGEINVEVDGDGILDVDLGEDTG